MILEELTRLVMIAARLFMVATTAFIAKRFTRLSVDIQFEALLATAMRTCSLAGRTTTWIEDKTIIFIFHNLNLIFACPTAQPPNALYIYERWAAGLEMGTTTV